MHEALDSIYLGPPWVEYTLFFVISFVNVFLQNLKDIFVIKSTKLKAAFLGVITSIFFTTIVVLISKHGWISVIIVAITHFFGIYTAKWVSEMLEKKGCLKKEWPVRDFISYFFSKNFLSKIYVNWLGSIYFIGSSSGWELFSCPLLFRFSFTHSVVIS